jgi:hypothetical protein
MRLMSDDSVLYDTPLEFVASAIQRDDCAAQSVIPRGDGNYACACSCKRWEAIAPSLEQGLQMAREHTGVTERRQTPSPILINLISYLNKLMGYNAVDRRCGAARPAL